MESPAGATPETARSGTAASLGGPVATRDDINTLAHYYRGEMARMISWRDRIDRTTNWAIGAMAAMLSVALASPAAHHGVLLFAMVLAYLLLHIEARRYRFFDVYRCRVRLLERNYYSRFFDPPGDSGTPQWNAQLAESLRQPQFHLTRRQALARRLLRNYRWIFTILLAAWLLKTAAGVALPSTADTQAVHSLAEWLAAAALGRVPGWLVILLLTGFYGWLGYLSVRHRRAQEGELTFGEVHF